MTFAKLVEVFRSSGLKVFVDEEHEVMALVCMGGPGCGTEPHGGPKTVLVKLLGDDEVLQLRGILPLSMGHVPPALQLPLYRRLMQLNLENGLSKISIDEGDGEVVVEVDCLLGDNDLEERQLHLLLSACLSALGECLDALVSPAVSQSVPAKRGVEQLLEQLRRVAESLPEEGAGGTNPGAEGREGDEPESEDGREAA